MWDIFVNVQVAGTCDYPCTGSRTARQVRRPGKCSSANVPDPVSLFTTRPESNGAAGCREAAFDVVRAEDQRPDLRPGVQQMLSVT